MTRCAIFDMARQGEQDSAVGVFQFQVIPILAGSQIDEIDKTCTRIERVRCTLAVIKIGKERLADRRLPYREDKPQFVPLFFLQKGHATFGAMQAIEPVRTINLNHTVRRAGKQTCHACRYGKMLAREPSLTNAENDTLPAGIAECQLCRVLSMGRDGEAIGKRAARPLSRFLNWQSTSAGTSGGGWAQESLVWGR